MGIIYDEKEIFLLEQLILQVQMEPPSVIK